MPANEKHILPADDDNVSDLTAAIIEALDDALTDRADVHESSETGEVILDLWKGQRGGKRRFRVQLIEVFA